MKKSNQRSLTQKAVQASEFEERMGQIKAPRGEKTSLVEAAIARQPGDFSVSDLQKECPGVGVDLIRQVLKRQKKAAQLVCLGRGMAAKWRKTSKWVLPI